MKAYEYLVECLSKLKAPEPYMVEEAKVEKEMYDGRLREQRFFTIPADKMDLFLVKLSMTSDARARFEAAYIFEQESMYIKDRTFDVVVNMYGKSNKMGREIEPFVQALNREEPKPIETCPSCGHDQFAVARNMIATRQCMRCHHKWEPNR